MNDINKAIDMLQSRTFCGVCTTSSTKGLERCQDCCSYRAKKLAKAALQEKRERDSPEPLTMEPLTMEQLQTMDGEPVWCPIYGWGIVLHTMRGKRDRTVIVFARCWKLAKNILPDGIYRNQRTLLHDP